MATKRAKLIVAIDLEYDDETFEPSVDPPKGKAGLCDVASYVETMESDIVVANRQRGHEPIYRFADVTVYNLEDFKLDLQEGKIHEAQPAPADEPDLPPTDPDHQH